METENLTYEERLIGNELLAKHSGVELNQAIFDTEISLLYPIIKWVGKITINGYTPFITLTNHGCTIEVGGQNLKFRGVKGANMIENTFIVLVEFLGWYYSEYDTNWKWFRDFKEKHNLK